MLVIFLLFKYLVKHVVALVLKTLEACSQAINFLNVLLFTLSYFVEWNCVNLTENLQIILDLIRSLKSEKSRKVVCFLVPL